MPRKQKLSLKVSPGRASQLLNSDLEVTTEKLEDTTQMQQSKVETVNKTRLSKYEKQASMRPNYCKGGFTFEYLQSRKKEMLFAKTRVKKLQQDHIQNENHKMYEKLLKISKKSNNISSLPEKKPYLSKLQLKHGVCLQPLTTQRVQASTALAVMKPKQLELGCLSSRSTGK